MKRLTALYAFLLIGSMLMAQTPAKKAGDYIESFTNNVPTGMVPRDVQYLPDGEAFVCVNGKNRYTRALYGSHSDFRVETSDRPVFALYKPKNYRNVRFYANGVQLDEAEWCEARYAEGRRSYTLKDARWGNGAVLTVDCVAMPEADGCLWRFAATGFVQDEVVLESRMCEIANPKLKRNGDIGADKAGSFEPAPDEAGLETAAIRFKNESFAVASLDDKVYSLALVPAGNSVGEDYNAACNHFRELASRVMFRTPEPWINTLGSALTLAADGAWDGETWLHGAIGWRMPLAGWRAGYLGDVLGWNDRAISHFNAYANSQVTDVPPTIDSPTQDKEMNLARAEKRWGTQMYSNGYICRNPNKNNQMHHYDMNLNYIDELLWHFQYDADTAYMRRMWPVLTSHLAWEKRNFDKDGNHLYDAYCCIWASDALYYNGGEVTHSTAYNYRGNLLAAKIARLIGEDATPYQKEADAILEAMNKSLWVDGHWAEYKDVMGLKRLHPNAALWSIYTPIDCGVGTQRQMYSCTKYVDANIPHIKVEMNAESAIQRNVDYNSVFSLQNPLYLVSTSNWMPYSWSINNVASAEIMHTALALFEAGRQKEGLNLLKANIMDQMYLGSSPGNLGQISYYDAARGESYRDFGDNIGISARAIVQGLFGIVPQALDGKCIIRPGFPLSWDSVEVRTPYLSYKYRRVNNKAVFTVEQHFRQPLQIVVRINTEQGRYIDYPGTANALQFVAVDVPEGMLEEVYSGRDISDKNEAFATQQQKYQKQNQLAIPFNASVTDIFRNEYLSPRPQSTSLEIPVQGIGEWCHPKFTVDINDSVFRAKAAGGIFTAEGVRFATPQTGQNILFASLWDNYPDSVEVPLKKHVAAKCAAIMLAGSTNHMQFDMVNALVTAEYEDGTQDTLKLIPPYNYCPIEQDYYVDGKAFSTSLPRPVRICLGTGDASADLGTVLGIPPTEVYGREIQGGAAQLLFFPLKPQKKVKAFRLRCLSNDIVVGVMAITMLN